MTIGQAIDRIDHLYPNHFDYATKLEWLSELDGRVFNEILSTHADCPVEAFHGYSDATDKDTELLIPYPYATDTYTRYLETKLNQEYKEVERYNMSAAAFEHDYTAFSSWYNRCHMPLNYGRFKF